MVANNQLSLQFDIIVPLGKGKRLHYKVPTYTKSYSNDVHQDGTIKDDSVWTQMHQTYKSLSNWIPVQFGGEPEEFVISGIRIWNDNYKAERYEYYNQYFQGQEFTTRFAEIIGTERLEVKDRLRVHEELLTYLRNGMELKESVNKVLKSIERVNNE